MILTRNEIRTLIQDEKLIFEPVLDKYQDQPHAVDMRLGTTFYLPKIWKISDRGREVLTVDVTQSVADNFEKIELEPGQFFELAPGESVIASTYEKVSLRADDLMGVLYPRSSVNRRGLSVDLTGIVDAHYSGHLMIPILNKTTSQIIRIYPGERICQIVFQRLASGLQKEEAMRHGAHKAKYEGAAANGLAGKCDADDELELIRMGRLSELKKQKK